MIPDNSETEPISPIQNQSNNPLPTPQLQRQNRQLKLVIGFLAVLLLLAVMRLLIIESMGYLYVGQKSPKQQEPLISSTPQSITQTQTENTIPSDWKTYSNNDFKFSIKYPDGASIKLNSSFSTDTENIIDVDLETIKFIIHASKSESELPLIMINTENNKIIAGANWSITNLKERTIDFGYSLPGNGPFTVYQKINNKIKYAIIINGQSPEIDQILSTFKFTDQDQENVSGQCINKNLGISLQLPDTWKCKVSEYWVNINSDYFQIDMSNLGRGPYCGTSPEETDCETSKYYQDQKITLNLFKYKGENKEIFGNSNTTFDTVNGTFWIAIKYDNMEKETMKSSEETKLIQMIESIKKL